MTRLAKIWLFSLLGILIIGGVGGAGYFMVNQHIEQEQKKQAAESLKLQEAAANAIVNNFMDVRSIKFTGGPYGGDESGYYDVTSEVTTSNGTYQVSVSMTREGERPSFSYDPGIKLGSTDADVSTTYLNKVDKNFGF